MTFAHICSAPSFKFSDVKAFCVFFLRAFEDKFRKDILFAGLLETKKDPAEFSKFGKLHFGKIRRIFAKVNIC